MSVADGQQVLTPRALGRATLARQGLLDRLNLDPVSAMEAIGGLQAQEPASPYIALWARLVRFTAGDLDRAFGERAVVKATLMRSTLHAVSAADYPRLQPVVMPMGRGIRRPDRQLLAESQLAELVRAAATITDEPRSLAEIGQYLVATGIAPDRPADELVWWLRRFAPLVHAPTSGLPWVFGRRPRLVDAGAWLGDTERRATAAATVAAAVALAEPEGAVRHLVRRYLGAFGPATAADLRAWSGVPVSTFRTAVTAMDALGELWRGRDQRGRLLMDLLDSPRPDPETPVAARLLPMWDSTLLAHADRTRIISDDDRALVIARNGDTLPTFLVDGEVAGLWWADPGPGGRTHITIQPFRPLDRATRHDLETEAAGLAAFVEPLEPAVYARYQRWRPSR